MTAALRQTFESLPGELPIFPLSNVLLLPRGQLPLNIFEHRYVAMVDEAIRTREAGVLLDEIAKIDAERLPVVLTGDFNTTPGSGAYRLIAQHMTDVRKAAPKVGGPDKTFHNYTGKPDQRIDWIFETGFTPLSDTTLTMHRGALYPSDHFPVLATLGWGG